MIITKKEIEPVRPSKNVYVLQLNDYEAGILMQVCEMVGGRPEGPRGVMDKLHKLLYKHKVYFSEEIKATGEICLEEK